MAEDLHALDLVHAGQGCGDGLDTVLVCVDLEQFGVVGKTLADRLALGVGEAGVHHHQVASRRSATTGAVAVALGGRCLAVAVCRLLVGFATVAIADGVGGGRHGAIEQQAWLQRDQP